MRRALLDAQAVLVGHGFVDWVAGGAAPDRVLVVADDFSLKPGAWRWDGAAWVAQPRMDVPAFVADLKAIFATPSAWNALMVKYPLFYPASMAGDWPAIEWAISDGNATGAITAQQYAAIGSAVAARVIPVTLA